MPAGSHSTALLCLGAAALTAALAAEPLPSVSVNCSHGPLALGPNTPLALVIGLDAAGSEAEPADWWLAADTPFGLFYKGPGGGWAAATDLNEVRPFYQGPLVDLTPTEALYVAALPPGSYRIYFGVDRVANGLIDFDQLSFDAVEVIRPAQSRSRAKGKPK